MAGIGGSYIPLIEPATVKELQQISDDLKLGISDDEIEVYLVHVNRSVRACDSLRLFEEETAPVLYPRIPGVTPLREDNPYNAWATKMVLKGESTGLLAGKTLAIKDNVLIAGTPLTNGSKIWEGYTPDVDATVVTRILQAGGTITGKSTCENQCFSTCSHTSTSGPVLNPHDTTRSAGGSSSGSAVLVATGEVDMAIGGDQGGSIRIPSSLSGCVGLKPTFGLVPVTGCIGMEPSVDHLGPMASNVTDVATLLEVIAGYDEGRDHRQRPDLEIPKYSQLLKGDLKGKKFGNVKEGYERATDGVKSVINDLIDRLRSAGAVVEDVSIPVHKIAPKLFAPLMSAFYESMIRSCGQAPGFNELYNLSATRHLQNALQSGAHDLAPRVKQISLFGEYVKRKDRSHVVGMAMNRRPVVRKAYNDMLDKYDALIMPTIPYVSPKLPHENRTGADLLQHGINSNNVTPFNLTGHPALTLNVGKAIAEDDESKQLPVGLQIICKHFEESKLLDISYGIETLLVK